MPEVIASCTIKRQAFVGAHEPVKYNTTSYRVVLNGNSIIIERLAGIDAMSGERWEPSSTGWEAAEVIRKVIKTDNDLPRLVLVALALAATSVALGKSTDESFE